MTVQFGMARTAFGSFRARGQVAVDNHTDRGGAGLSVLSNMNRQHTVADCWLTGDELRALRDHLSELLDKGRV